MRLYVPRSSPASWKTLLAFGKTVLGGDANAGVYVAGNLGKLKQAFKGNGKLYFIKDTTTLNTLCEFYSPPATTTTVASGP